MSISHGPTMAESGLMFCFDAANTKSYPGSGNTWYSLNSEYTASIVGTNFFTGSNGGGFNYATKNTGNYILLPAKALQDLPTPNTWSLCFWVKTYAPNTGMSHAFSLAKTNAESNWLIFRATTGYKYDIYGRNIALTVSSGGWPSFAANSYDYICIVVSAAGTYLYKNGERTTIATAITNIHEGVTWNLIQEQDSVGGTFDVNQCYLGNFFSISLYSRALSAEEVRYNYDATRRRFGK